MIWSSSLNLSDSRQDQVYDNRGYQTETPTVTLAARSRSKRDEN